MESKTTVTYTLFLYRKELHRSQCRYKTLNRTKLSLTDKLITNSVRNIRKCSMSDLQAINREMAFKKILKQQIKRIRQLEKMGMKNVNPNKLPSMEF
ncbi:uncharacterized protein LOC111687481 [Lucilia cuprina]|uniref:uncharacterized protein LOC111687481 n=1 Tax=Lucilia cuprina TaxID=7375 RepID=UPI000C719F4A|nr:uncharacterized protein LOC111687481 [Lucilia cuprina]